MKIDVEKFLAITAFLATGAIGGCTVTENHIHNDDGAGGNPGADSGDGAGGKATGGSVGSGGKTGTGGTTSATGGASSDGGPEASAEAGPGDGGTDAKSDATTGTCLGDDAPPVPVPDAGDAAVEGGISLCASLPFPQDTWCADAGVEGHGVVGATLCQTEEYNMRPGVFAALVDCLKKLPATGECSRSHELAAIACFDEVTAKACDRAPPGDGGTDVCKTFAAGCSAISEVKCRQVLSSFSEESLSYFEPCVSATSTDGGTCAANFWTCVLPIGVVP